MKKQYISPNAQVVLLDMQQMLAASPGGDVNGNITAPGESQLSREHDDFNVSGYWDTTEND